MAPRKRKTSRGRSKSRSKSRSRSRSKSRSTSPRRKTRRKSSSRKKKRKSRSPSPRKGFSLRNLLHVPNVSHIIKRFNTTAFAHRMSIFHVVNRILLFVALLAGWPNFGGIVRTFGLPSFLGLPHTPLRLFLGAAFLTVGLFLYRFSRETKYKQRGAFFIGLFFLGQGVLDYFYGGFLKTGSSFHLLAAVLNMEHAAFFLHQVAFLRNDKGFGYLLKRLQFAPDAFLFLKVSNLLSTVFPKAPTFMGDSAWRAFFNKHSVFLKIVRLVNRIPFVHIPLDKAVFVFFSLAALAGFLLYNGSSGKVGKWAREVKAVFLSAYVCAILSAAVGCIGRFSIFELHYAVARVVGAAFTLGCHFYHHH
jgi:hypothetical protein